ncbi:MAG: M24 family metallopeptidase [Ferrovum sp.]|nr:M24 family metallopeptidase [Ferrovum sp.]
MTIEPKEVLVYRQRRERVQALMDDVLWIIPTSPEVPRNADSHYGYRWNSYFYYLTGCKEPEAVLVLMGGANPRSILVVRPKDPDREQWEGIRLGPQGAQSQLGFTESYPLEELDGLVHSLLPSVSRLVSFLGYSNNWDQRLLGWLEYVRKMVRQGLVPLEGLLEARYFLDEMRLIKDPHELVVMQKSASIAGMAHHRAMRNTKPGRWEYQIQAEIEHEFRSQGALAPAYNTIVASGANACVLHYVENEAQLVSGDLVLVDAGCEYRSYASDITRTFPVSGRFSGPQRDLYEVVLAAQLSAIEQVQIGMPFVAYHQIALRVLVQGLLDLKICQGSVDSILEAESYKPFYMHKTGHWLGLDVHDAGSYVQAGQSRLLEDGMVLTVEPGLYIPPLFTVPAEFWHLGIRIEDDVRVTHAGPVVLTQEVVKTVEAIEQWMSSDEK